MLTAALFDEFDAAGNVRRGLPGTAYTSDAFMQAEREQLFRNNWVFVAFAHKLPRRGDVQPLEVGGIPIFLLRDERGEISAFHNVCRHRNLQLIDTPGNCGKLIRCPYHSWSYDLCGALKNAPYFGGARSSVPDDFNYAENGLVAIRCEVWHDWVFINLGAQASDFEAHIAPIKRQLHGDDVTEYVPVTTIDLGEIPCNWKLLMENFIEPYHVQFVHKNTTRQPLDDHTTLVDEHCFGCVVELDDSLDASPDKLSVSSHFLALFPNFVLGSYHPNQIGVHLNEPLSAGITRQQRVIYMHRDTHYSDLQIRQLEELWRNVHREDHEMCVRLQQGRHSPLAQQGGVLSPNWENSVRKFQERIADAVRPALA